MTGLTGTAAGVPFTALPPDGDPEATAPLLVTWHMLDAPRTDAAFAAALPLTGVRAWRVHLGMPMCGARMVGGRLDAHVELARRDVLTAYLAPVVRQAVEELPAALAALRDRLPVDDGPIGLLGASLGGAVALEVLAAPPAPVRSVALVNPAVRLATATQVIAGMLGEEYRWTPEAQAAATDHVARAGELPSDVSLLLVSGEQDHPGSRADAAELVAALRARSTRPVELSTVPGLAHALADEPGLEPAPPWPVTGTVDDLLAGWFRREIA